MGFESIFVGKMLGDGHLNRNKRRIRFSFIQTLNDKGYADYCYDLLKPYISFGSGCTKVEHIKDKRNGNTYSRIYYQSRVMDLLDELYPIWYVNNRKVIPKDFIEEFLDNQGLAIWYQDDGCYKHKCNGILLSTECYTDEEISFLQDILNRKFYIHSKIDCQRRLDISTRSEVRKFLSLVEPYIHNSMERKSIYIFWKSWEETWYKSYCDNSKICRTTIYLNRSLHDKITGTGYSQLINFILDKWLEHTWKCITSGHSMLYDFIVKNQPVCKGTCSITPRLRSDIKAKLEILSQVSGFEKSELVTIALQGSALLK